MNWKTLKSEIVFKNPFYEITKETCETASGRLVEGYYTIKRPNVIVVAAITEDRQVILINQYRQPVRSRDIELPAGYIENEETPIQAAKRELLEETGYTSENFKELKTAFASAGTMSNTIHFFLATKAKKVADQKLDPNEELSVHPTPIEEAFKFLEEGKIKDMASISGLLLIKDLL